ncbi:hypothetical protein LUX33_40425 [Actinomadura madurae]|uniref:hypothetical protein n=1 Tax=Actinomadura madurae TaxID=1993 RepID=UPI0020D2102A|nr:hypothetical protein [Actinomadura madurae]MCP9954069.1 hypothetical protein [Actinomadura madurae]MCP9970813.1 hypothetical protein [Actinomadura madurae]
MIRDVIAASRSSSCCFFIHRSASGNGSSRCTGWVFCGTVEGAGRGFSRVATTFVVPERESCWLNRA